LYAVSVEITPAIVLAPGTAATDCPGSNVSSPFPANICRVFTVTTVASGSVVTLTATVKAGSAAVTLGQVKFCDATATYCEDPAVLGTA
jgi:hypothetical protein